MRMHHQHRDVNTPQPRGSCEAESALQRGPEWKQRAKSLYLCIIQSLEAVDPGVRAQPWAKQFPLGEGNFWGRTQLSPPAGLDLGWGEALHTLHTHKTRKCFNCKTNLREGRGEAALRGQEPDSSSGGSVPGATPQAKDYLSPDGG